MTEKSSQSVHHSFDINIAKELGSIDLAVLLHHIAYWVNFNKTKDKNFHNGRYWMYQTLDDMAAHHPYWSVDQVRRMIKKLIEKGYIVKDTFNNNSFDRTTWYSINSEITTSMWRNRQMEKAKSPNPNGEVAARDLGDYITDTKTDAKTNTKEYIAPTHAKHGREQVKDLHYSPQTGRFEGVTDQDKNDWKDAYPNIDIRKECAAAIQWLKSNPTKAKKKNWRKFLTGWFQRQNDQQENKKAYRAQNSGNKVDRRTKNIDGTPVDSPADGLF